MDGDGSSRPWGEVMPDDDEFNELLRRAKAGDDGAIRDFLSRFEQEVQTMVRSRLPKKLRTQFDSTDFVQSVWQSFFVDSTILAILTMSSICGDFCLGWCGTRCSEQHRRLTKTEKYDLAREERLYVRRGDREVPREVVSPEPSPSQAVQAADRMAQLTAGRSPLEIEVLTLRRQGLTFVEIADRTGINERTVRRVIETVRSADGVSPMALESNVGWLGARIGNPDRDARRCWHEFTAAWERGEAPVVEEYLGRLDPADSQAAVELIYREFCLSEADGCKPDVSHYLDRFPQHRTALERLIRLHGECPPSLLDRWMETTPSLDSLPEVGDAIGPYVLRRELGRGGFARVFPGRADRPRESPGRAQGVDENDPRAVALGAGAACPHRRDRVPRPGERRRFPVDLHAVLGGCDSGRGTGGARARDRKTPCVRGSTCSRTLIRSPPPSFRPFTRRGRPVKCWRASPTVRRSRGSAPGWPRHSTTRLAGTWPTETSSLPTSCCPPMAIRCSSTSTWPATGRRPA